MKNINISVVWREPISFVFEMKMKYDRNDFRLLELSNFVVGKGTSNLLSLNFELTKFELLIYLVRNINLLNLNFQFVKFELMS